MNAAQRVTFASPALLDAGDLAAALEHELELAGLHVRAVHGSWGIALGLELSPPGTGGVRVGPGLAWDCHGRAVLAPAPFLVGHPPIEEGDAVLLVARAPDARAELPRWRWWRPGRDRRARLGEEIPLGRFSVGESGIEGPDPAPRRHVPWPAPPQLSAGRVEQASASGSLGAWSLTVDTTAAGFRETPHYFVTLEGDPLKGVAGAAGVHGPYLSIRSASPGQFVLDVRHAAPGGLPAQLRGAGAFALPVPVAWTGVLVRAGCAVEKDPEPEGTPT